MLQLTIKELLLQSEQIRIREEAYEIYIFRDEETIFYVGKSNEPEERLLSHLGRGRHASTTSIGQFILRHAPESDLWLFQQYTVEECIPFVDQYRLTLPERVQAFYKSLGDQNRCQVHFAEEALINIHRPPFNTAMNPNPNPLPEKYMRELAKPSDSSGLKLAI